MVISNSGLQDERGLQNANATSGSDNGNGNGIGQTLTRVSKACEPCRIRKTKCDIATKEICNECARRNKGNECVLRVKARPGRLSAVDSTRRGSKRPLSPSSPSSSSNQQSTYQTRDQNQNRPHSYTQHPSPSRSIIPAAPHSIRSNEHGSLSQFHPIDIPASPAITFDIDMEVNHPVLKPNSPIKQPVYPSLSVETSKIPPSNAIRNVEVILERLAFDRFGLSLSLAIPPEHVFSIRSAPRMTLDQIGLAPGDNNSIIRAREWINSHFAAIHHNTPFLNLPQINDIAKRFLEVPSISASSSGTSGPFLSHDNNGNHKKVGNDEAALLLVILALGSFRRETWDEQRKSYRTLNASTPSSTTTTAHHATNQQQPDLQDSYSSQNQTQIGIIPLTLFRLAQDELDELEYPSEAAVQALFLLHTFVSNTSMGRRSRDFVARAIMMAHELGLNRSIPMQLDVSLADKSRERMKMDQAATRRRAVLYLYVYFSDVYLAALDDSPPLIKVHDYSSDVFDPILNPRSTSGLDTPSGSSTSLGAFVDLVRTAGEILELLHGNKHRRNTSSSTTSDVTGGTGNNDLATLELVLRLDSQLDQLRDRLGSATFDINLDSNDNVDPSTRGITAGKLLRQIHYNWFRIAVRAPFLNHPLLGHSSLAICADSALSLLHYHRYVINAGLLNLPWMQLRRITTAIHVIFIAYWKGELTKTSASTAIDNAMILLKILSARWQSATNIALLVVDLAKRSEVPVQQYSFETGQNDPAQPFVQHNGPAIDPSVININPPPDSATWFDLASIYPEQNQLDPNNTGGLSQFMPSEDFSQDISNWLPAVTTGDNAWPDDSVDFWTNIMGPLG
ncbi:uncharacterized protein L201_000251 [Kwoniella dendrophila CBS 6074]|uniref:Zn(2)-C6 fungal-type domain-containing protein n=1 Tax=Kwoniella dendrophila CBS 6074 TaxID=1295534 RepID=A0AAX4JKJ5_9TREE